MSVQQRVAVLQSRYGAKAIEHARHYLSFWRKGEEGYSHWAGVIAALEGNP